MASTTIMEEKIEKIESEIYSLKSIIINLIQHPEHKKIVKLKGLLKGIKVNENDIEDVKHSLFKTGA